MSGLSSIGETAVLAPLIASAYVSLHTADPGNTGTSEISTSGTGYARLPVTFAQVSGPNPTVEGNTAVLTFNTATAAWGTISFFGVWDALTAGNYRGSGALTVATPVNNGDTARFLGNSLTITAQ